MSPRLTGETEENHEKLKNDSESPDRNLNPECAQYEAGINHQSATFALFIQYTAHLYLFNAYRFVSYQNKQLKVLFICNE
jgi:hypothetical protein